MEAQAASEQQAALRIQTIFRCYRKFRTHRSAKRAMMAIQARFIRLQRQRQFRKVGLSQLYLPPLSLIRVLSLNMRVLFVHR